MAFYQKYRAKTFHEMVGQSHVVATLLEALKSGKIIHSYLLTGPRGIGKTSTARLLAKAINCQNPHDGEPCNECDSCKEIAGNSAVDVIEIDAASHTGVDDIRDLIEKARLCPAKLTKKVYIIDEVHMLSKSAFNALLKTLEEPPLHVVFIMATTEVHKIPATILSRAQRYDFKRATMGEISENLKRIANSEKIDIDDEAIELIALSAEGGHRDAIGLLEQVASSGEKVTISFAREILGIADSAVVFEFIGAIFNANPEEGLKIAHKLYEKGNDMTEFNRSVIETLRKVMLYQSSKTVLFDDTKENVEKIASFAKQIEKQRLIEYLKRFIEANSLLKDVSFPLLPIEVAIVKCTASEAENEENIHLKKPEDKVLDDKIVKPREQARNEVPVVVEDTCTPVPVLDMTDDIWFRIIELTKEENTTLAALLRDARPEGLTDDALILGVKFKFHKDRISEGKNSEILEKVVHKVLGKNCKVICQLKEGKGKTANQVVDLEKTVEEVFEVE